MPYDENGEWVDDTNNITYGENDPTYLPQGNPGPVLQIPDDSNADNHGKIDQPTGGGGGGGNNQGANVEAELKSRLGDLYTPGALEEAKHRDYDPGWIDRIVNKENLRRNNGVGSEYHDNGQGGYLTPPKPVSKLVGGFNGGAAAASGGYSGSSGGTSSSNMFGTPTDISSVLKGLFPGGAFNQDIVNRRLDSVRSTLDAQRKQAINNNEAYLADRGLVGSGPQATASNNLESRLFGQFGSAYNDIYANEEQAADARMVQALQLATGMTEQEAQNQIDWFRAQTEKELGQGNIALGYGNLAARNSENDTSRMLGLGNIDIGRMNASTNSYKAQTDYDVATKQLEQARRDYDEAVRVHDMEAADRAQQRINELEQIRAAGTHR